MEPARRASRLLVAPLAPVSIAEILVVPDGPLAQIPIEILVPRADGVPWGATRRIIYGPSASVLLALSRSARWRVWQRSVLAVGNPSAPPQTIGLTPREYFTPAPLPYAQQEARAVRDRFRTGGADLLLGPAATVERWLALRRLPLRAELVTLSACETALGRRIRGEGTVGLAHAFLAAGARGVVVTFWRVSDRSAADFMREFYGEVAGHTSPAAALLTVRKRWIAERGARAHPSRCAPFVLVAGPDL
ncbi:MAG: CHAT domain-containing protein [Gemmatimonadales bacterium]